MIRIYFLIYIGLSWNVLLGQTSIDGKYRYTKGLYGKTLYLSNDNSFTSYSGIITGHGSFISKGYYLVRKDTLLLFYDSLPSEYAPSKYTIVSITDSTFSKIGKSQKIPDNMANIYLSVQDFKGNPLAGCNIALMSSTNRIVSGYVSDENGKAKFNIDRNSIDTIVVSWLGHKPMWITANKLWGHYSILKVELGEESNNSFNKKYKIERYIIKKSDSGKTKLDMLHENSKISFETLDN